MTGLSVPRWGGVDASLLLVALAAAVALRHRLGLTRELIVAAARAGIQLVAVVPCCSWCSPTPGCSGPSAGSPLMVVIAGQVAGRRGSGLPRARRTATTGIAVGSAVTLGALLTFGVISTQLRVVIPVGGMIVSGACKPPGSLCAVFGRTPKPREMPSKPACRWGCPLARRSSRINGRRCAQRCSRPSIPPKWSV